MKQIDITGCKFGRLTVLEKNGKDNFGQVIWKCRCECGNTTFVRSYHLRSGHTKSCGCLERETKTLAHTIHGKRNTRLYEIWAGMKSRCLNPSIREYKWYGAKGVVICPEWLNDFQAFYDWAIAHGYADNLTIDRIDNNKGYSPDNCRWATKKEQQNNRSNNRFLTYNGETHNISEWAKKFGVEYFKFYRLLKQNSFNIERVVECTDI